MARRMTRTIRDALAAFDIASPRHRDLPFLIPRCPLCHGLIAQSTTGERRILRHFTCPACGFWVIVEDAAIRESILGSADRDDDNDHAHGHGFGYLWFNAETGKLILYPTDAAYRRRQEFLARAAQEATS